MNSEQVNSSPPHRPANGSQIWWNIAQAAALIITLSLIVSLFIWPAASLGILWNLLIPILPATFLLSPNLWRGICPLATIDQFSSRLRGGKRANLRWVNTLNFAGILLLILMVPARRFVFNENGTALAITIVLVALLALGLGLVFDRRAGFCNGLCPILPVERIYGHFPLIKVANHRCAKCSLCIPKGCLDLDPAKSIAFATHSVFGGQYSWLKTVHGAFSAAFPGFIFGYFTISNVAFDEAVDVYLWVLVWSAVSYCLTCLIVITVRLSRQQGLMLAVAAAVILYYWWAAALISESLHLGNLGAEAGRIAAFGLVAFWLISNWRSKSARTKNAWPIA